MNAQRLTDDAWENYRLRIQPKSERLTIAMRHWELERLDTEAKEHGMNKGNYILALLSEQWRKEDADEAALEAAPKPSEAAIAS